MKRTKLQPLFRTLTLAAIAATPSLVGANDGPYIGIETGANFHRPQSYVDGSTEVESLHFDTGWVGGLVGGYSFANGFRPELEIDYRSNFLRDAFPPAPAGHGPNANGYQNAESVFANIWYDVKRPDGLFHYVHPYIGGGIGGVRFADRNLSIGGHSNDWAAKPAYQAGAGIGFDITRHLSAALDYRYLDSQRGAIDPGFGPYVATNYRAEATMISARYSFGEPPKEAPPPLPPPAPPPPPVVMLPPPAPVCNPPAGFKVDANCHIIEQTVILRAVDFEFDSDKLTQPAQQTLDEVAAALAAQLELNVQIEGHTDSIGSARYNMRLSQRRADSVKAYLVSKGASDTHLVAQGYGKNHPIVSNDTAEGRAQNRRVEFEVQNKPFDVKVVQKGATSASTAAAKLGKQPRTAGHRGQ